MVVKFIMAQLDPQASSRSFSPQRIFRLALATLVAFAAVFLLALVMPSIERHLDKWGLLPRHEQLTELYIPNAKNLPASYTPGEEHTVLFEIRNLEGEAQTYNYIITARKESGGVVMELDKGSIRVDSNQTRDVQLSATLHDLGKRIYVQVELSNGQKVGYWLGHETK